MSASTEAFSTFNQIMAARGWLVFSPNYRGSTTQGKTFQSAVINDAGEGPGRDVMSGVDVLKIRGIVDETRVAVSGWSYGGYMTAWLTAHYDGWTVAMAECGPGLTSSAIVIPSGETTSSPMLSVPRVSCSASPPLTPIRHRWSDLGAVWVR